MILPLLLSLHLTTTTAHCKDGKPVVVNPPAEAAAPSKSAAAAERAEALSGWAYLLGTLLAGALGGVWGEQGWRYARRSAGAPLPEERVLDVEHRARRQAEQIEALQAARVEDAAALEAARTELQKLYAAARRQVEAVGEEQVAILASARQREVDALRNVGDRQQELFVQLATNERASLATERYKLQTSQEHQLLRAALAELQQLVVRVERGEA